MNSNGSLDEPHINHERHSYTSTVARGSKIIVGDGGDGNDGKHNAE
jgi:hypothetical protein